MHYNEVNTLHIVSENFATLVVSYFSVACVPGYIFFYRIINFSHFGFIAVRLSERKRRRLDNSSVESCISGENAKVFLLEVMLDNNVMVNCKLGKKKLDI